MVKRVRNKELIRYISHEYMLSFLISFIFFFFIFFVNQLLLIAKNILLKNISFKDMSLIIIYSIPIILSYTFPFSSLSGAAMAIGDLVSKNEIQAMRSLGISYKKIFTPIVILSLALSGISFILNDIFLPLGTIEYKKLYKSLLYRNPGLELEPYSVVRFDDMIFITGAENNNTIQDIIVIDRSDNNIGTLHADAAEILPLANDKNSISLVLKNVNGLYRKGSSISDIDYFYSKQMTYSIYLESISYSFLSVAPNEMSIRDVYNEIQAKKKVQLEKKTLNSIDSDKIIFQLGQSYYAGELDLLKSYLLNIENLQKNTQKSRSLQYYEIEFQKKIALPLACFFLVFFSFPISIIQLRNGKLVGFGVGVIASAGYWFLLFGAQTVGSRELFSPFLLMWAPNLLLFSIGTFLFVLRSRR